MNSLRLVFGPRVPHELESLALSFVAAPVLEPGTSIASLSTERYVRQNYPHLDEIPIVPSAPPGSKVTVSVAYAGTDGAGLFGSVLGGWDTLSGVHVARKQGFTLDVVDTPIVVSGVRTTQGGSWCPEIVQGLCVRPYVVTGNESADSWVGQALTELGSGVVGAGDRMFLLYTVPEAKYQARSTASSTNYPGNDVRVREVREIASVLTPRSIGYEGRIKDIKSIAVNGVSVFGPGAFDNGTESAAIERFDNALRQVFLRQELRPRDRVELVYRELGESYTYSGYRDKDDVWYPLDANPEWGHYIADPRLNEMRPSADCLLEAVTLYAIPSALLVVRARGRKDGDPADFGGEAAFTFVSAYDYGETHFVRHRVSGVGDEEILERVEDGSINTWGYARLGVNRYDENVQAGDDVFDRGLPFAMPLGRLVLSAPASVNSVASADVRQRGGGVPEQFPMAAVSAEENGLDRLRGFWDMGIWDGKVVKEGGVVEIQIDRSVLSSFESAEVYRIVRSQVPPGIAFEIKYVDMEAE